MGFAGNNAGRCLTWSAPYLRGFAGAPVLSQGGFIGLAFKTGVQMSGDWRVNHAHDGNAVFNQRNIDGEIR